MSYRRADSAGYVRAVYERLAQRVGRDRVFLDVDAIEGGRDYRATLEEAIANADALVLVIGPRWLEERPGGGSRLHEPDDVVRFEIRTALSRDVRIVPVLVDGAAMPAAAALPDEIRALATRNALTVSNDRFDADVRLLLSALVPAGAGTRAARAALGAAIAITAVFTIVATGWSAYVPVLLIAAGAVAILLYLVMRRSALRWVPVGRILVHGLSVAAFALLLLGGTTLRARRLAAPFTAIVRLTPAEPFAGVAPDGEVVLDVGGDARRRPVDANGEAVFAGLPGRVAAESVTLTVDVAGYEPVARTMQIPLDRIIEVPLTPRIHRTMVRGVVQDEDGRPAPGVTLDFGGMAEAVSDELGRFQVVVPVAPGSAVMLRAVRDSVTGYHERVRIPAELPLEVRFDRGG
ncbi:MAG: toll/interleukin-1 receptor domain-containing protein [Gemmatimonadetes bacterium]|nr:toll/interleukin-1 receptor domain-containing protein [Gemmatimonadota bacterium]